MSDQPVARVSRDDVARVVRRDFAAAEYETVLGVLEEYGNDAERDRDNARVHMAVLKLANGNLSELRKHIEIARQDYRDVLSAAEYPAATRRWSELDKLSNAERQKIYDSDWEQYQRWLNEPGHD